MYTSTEFRQKQMKWSWEPGIRIIDETTLLQPLLFLATLSQRDDTPNVQTCTKHTENVCKKSDCFKDIYDFSFLSAN